jgi:hypothetical protein
VSDVISLTVTEDVAIINLEITEQAPVQVNFSQIAVADPAVAQAKLDAEAAKQAAETAQAAAEAAATLAQNTVANISTVVDTQVAAAMVPVRQEIIINALIFG